MKKDLLKSNSVTLKNISNKLSQHDVPVSLKISELKDHPDNEFLFGGLSDEDIIPLAKDIREHGLISKINVWKLPEGGYTIFDGHRRRRGLAYNEKHFNGVDLATCYVWEYPESETLRRRMLLAGNVYNRGGAGATASVLYAGRQIQYMKETLEMEGFTGNMRVKLAEEFGWTPSSIQRYQSLVDCVQRVIDAVDSGEFPLAQASSLSKLSENKQILIMDALATMKKSRGNEEHINRDEIQNLIDAVKNDKELDNADKLLRNVEHDNAKNGVKEQKQKQNAFSGSVGSDNSFVEKEKQGEVAMPNGGKDITASVSNPSQNTNATNGEEDGCNIDHDNDMSIEGGEADSNDTGLDVQTSFHDTNEFEKNVLDPICEKNNDSDKKDSSSEKNDSAEDLNEITFQKFLKTANRLEEFLADTFEYSAEQSKAIYNDEQVRTIAKKLDYLDNLISKVREQFSR